jgi:DNA-directed RNA polymerase I, II, and III subunit RPABC5
MRNFILFDECLRVQSNPLIFGDLPCIDIKLEGAEQPSYFWGFALQIAQKLDERSETYFVSALGRYKIEFKNAYIVYCYIRNIYHNIMIIPVLCYSCSNPLADKYRYYVDEVRKRKMEAKVKEQVTYLTSKNTEKTIEGKLMDEMGIDQPCCRRHFMTHVDID